MKLSIFLSSHLKLPPHESIAKAAELGFDAVQLPVGAGPWEATSLTKDQRKRLLDEVKRHNLRVSGVAAGGRNFPYHHPDARSDLLQRVRQVAQLAADLDTHVWQSHIGQIPESPRDTERLEMLRTVGAAADIAYDHGVYLAVETGPEPPLVLLDFIDQVGSPGLKVNYDPANFILWPALMAAKENTGYDTLQAIEEFMPTEGVKILGPHIVHVHAKDARVAPEGTATETPLGEGWVRWQRLFELLRAQGFVGDVAIEREKADNPIEDVKKGARFLRSFPPLSPTNRNTDATEAS